ncbi:TPA_asm: N [Baccharis alphacytorhabdovirus 1]|nr:TPA_asm: N [Baccharis alphacytorhabdovirus 1]
MSSLTLEEKAALLKAQKAKKMGEKKEVRSGSQGQSSNQSTNQNLQQQNTQQQTVKILGVSNKYAEVSSANTGKLASLAWKDSELSKVHIYRVDVLSAAKCITLGQRLTNALKSGLITSTTGDICLTLALSLAQPGVSGFYPMLHPIPNTIGSTVAFSMPDGLQEASTMSKTAKAKLLLARKNLKKTDLSAEDRAKYEEIVANLEAQEHGTGSSTSVPVIRESDAVAYCYLAAFLMKLAGKDESMFLESLTSMAMRYAAWYDGATSLLTDFKPSVEALKTLRMVFNRRPEILSTWILTVAGNENREGELPQTHQGLLNFLAGQQYAYTGMHAYKLLLDIHEASGIPYSDLLAGFDCPITRNGIMEVLVLIRDHEITKANPDRTTYFRYARVWNPKYFMALQSSNCKTLVYVTAKVAKLIGAQKAGGDPTEIMAIKNLDKMMRDRLDIVAEKMANSIFDVMLHDNESGTAWA